MHRQLRYKGQVLVNVIGLWRKGQREPLWVMSNLAPEATLSIYAAGMKVKVMNKSQQHREQMAALVMIAYTIGLLFGEAIRDELFGPSAREPSSPQAESPSADTPKTPIRRKWQLYAGLFILLKQKVNLSAKTLRRLLRQVLAAFILLVQPLVRTHV